jgi:hypothetical protein
MTDKEIYSKIEEVYKTEGGKKFITHLLRNFFPVNKSQFSFFKPEKKRMVCCITGQKLCSKEDLFAAHMEVTPEEFGEYMKSVFDPEKKPVEHPVRKKLGNKILAVECEGSDKLLCQASFDQLYNFYATELLHGNKHMSWLGKDMIRKESVSHWQKLGIVENAEEEEVIRKAVNKPAKLSLGDLDVLKNLKVKLEASEAAEEAAKTAARIKEEAKSTVE